MSFLKGGTKVIDCKTQPKKSVRETVSYERFVTSESWGEEYEKQQDIFGKIFLLDKLQGQ